MLTLTDVGDTGSVHAVHDCLPHHVRPAFRTVSRLSPDDDPPTVNYVSVLFSRVTASHTSDVYGRPGMHEDPLDILSTTMGIA